MGSGSTTSWREVGRCKGVDPEVFYPEDDEDPGEEAKAICSMCSVRETCLEQAIVGREKIGVWGGYTARERRRLVRQRRRARPDRNAEPSERSARGDRHPDLEQALDAHGVVARRERSSARVGRCRSRRSCSAA